MRTVDLRDADTSCGAKARHLGVLLRAGLPVPEGVVVTGRVTAGDLRGRRSTVRRGDVLVCRTTDPGWTPLFGVVAAVVTETGGMLSHASIVAREVGLPAVVGAAERQWVTWSTFLEMSGWSLSTAGRTEGERLLATELQATGALDVVEAAHHSFLPLDAVVTGALTTVLTRFGGYRGRFLTALFRADDDPARLAGTSVDSWHRVWFELHEVLIATLGISR